MLFLPDDRERAEMSVPDYARFIEIILRSAVIKMQNADRVHLRIMIRTCDLWSKNGREREREERGRAEVSRSSRPGIDHGSANDRFN